MTYRYVAYDIQKNLYASFDDADFTINQVLIQLNLKLSLIQALDHLKEV